MDITKIIYAVIVLINLLETDGAQISINGRNIKIGKSEIYLYTDGELIHATCNVSMEYLKLYKDYEPRLYFEVNGKKYVETKHMDRKNTMYLTIRLLSGIDNVFLICHDGWEAKIRMRSRNGSNSVRPGWKINEAYFDLNLSAESVNYKYKFHIKEDLDILFTASTIHVTNCFYTIFTKAGISPVSIEINPIYSFHINKTSKRFEKSILFCTTLVQLPDENFQHSVTSITFVLEKISLPLQKMDPGAIIAISRSDLKISDFVKVFDVIIHSSRCKALVCFLTNDSRPIIWGRNEGSPKDTRMGYYYKGRSLITSLIYLETKIYPEFKKSIYPGCLDIRKEMLDMDWYYIEGNANNKSNYAQKLLKRSDSTPFGTSHRVNHYVHGVSDDGNINIITTSNKTHPTLVQKLKLKYKHMVLSSSSNEIDPTIDGLDQNKILLILTPNSDSNIILYEYSEESLKIMCNSQYSCGKGTLEYEGLSVHTSATILPLSSHTVNCSVECNGRTKVTLMKFININTISSSEDMTGLPHKEKIGDQSHEINSILTADKEARRGLEVTHQSKNHGFRIVVISAICVTVVMFVILVIIAVKVTYYYTMQPVCNKKNKGREENYTQREPAADVLNQPSNNSNTITGDIEENDYDYVYGSRIRSGLTDLQFEAVKWQNHNQWHSTSSLISDVSGVARRAPALGPRATTVQKNHAQEAHVQQLRAQKTWAHLNHAQRSQNQQLQAQKTWTHQNHAQGSQSQQLWAQKIQPQDSQAQQIWVEQNHAHESQAQQLRGQQTRAQQNWAHHNPAQEAQTLKTRDHPVRMQKTRHQKTWGQNGTPTQNVQSQQTRVRQVQSTNCLDHQRLTTALPRQERHTNLNDGRLLEGSISKPLELREMKRNN